MKLSPEFIPNILSVTQGTQRKRSIVANSIAPFKFSPSDVIKAYQFQRTLSLSSYLIICTRQTADILACSFTDARKTA